MKKRFGWCKQIVKFEFTVFISCHLSDLLSIILLNIKPRPNALDFSLYIARQMSSIVECCRELGSHF